MGNIAVTRAWFRAVALSVALVASLAPVRCLGQYGYVLPEKAIKELSPELLSLLQQKSMLKNSRILLRIFKEESELEVWKQDTGGRFQILKTYPICRWSGDLGPKLHEGDGQAPEGFYAVTVEFDESVVQVRSFDQHRLSQRIR